MLESPAQTLTLNIRPEKLSGEITRKAPENHPESTGGAGIIGRPSTSTMPYEQIAAVDLGSNSFHLEVGRVVYSQIYPLDILKEPVRLASGLTPEKLLDEASQDRALDTLSRFSERLRGFQPGAVRAVATNTLRVAKNAQPFLSKAERVLGFPIEVIAGREEARLIYLGAAHALPPTRDRRLVVDIGGGSTEFIIGKKIEPVIMDSLYMGCVSHSLRFFPDGRVDKKHFVEAELSAAREIQRIVRDYRQLGWSEAVVSSGTARAVADLLELNGLNPGGLGGITRTGLEHLRSLLIRAGSPAKLKLTGLRSDRVPVLPGGVAILCTIFSELDLDHMIYSEGALRLGVLYDLLGRFHRRDMRDTTVRRFMRRYHVDASQAERVKRTALGLFEQLAPGDGMDDPTARKLDVRMLSWAASLHEVGMPISRGGFHKHGAYITRFADMPGFSKKDQERLSFLILGQRGKLGKLMPAFSAGGAVCDPDCPDCSDCVGWRQVFCLRLATLLHRSRDDHAAPEIRVSLKNSVFSLVFPAGWLAANPLSASALVDEATAWHRVGFGFTFKRRPAGEGR